MRQIALDTETTGLEAKAGDRIVEIGAVELIQRRQSGRTFHVYLNPQRKMGEGAREITGLTDEFLADKPLFGDIVDEFLDFIRDSELIIHNAPFDVGFLNAELDRDAHSRGVLTDYAGVLDTLAMAREIYPGQRNSLDALCRRLGVDNTQRDLHGGLLDAKLLAEVYLAMTTGQSALDFGVEAAADPSHHGAAPAYQLTRRPLIWRASAEERAAHAARLDALEESGTPSLWRSLEAAVAKH